MKTKQETIKLIEDMLYNARAQEDYRSWQAWAHQWSEAPNTKETYLTIGFLKGLLEVALLLPEDFDCSNISIPKVDLPKENEYYQIGSGGCIKYSQEIPGIEKRY